MKSWHAMLEESINAELQDDRAHLEAITLEMQNIYAEFVYHELDWRRCLNQNYVHAREVWEALGKFHSQAVKHMKQLFYMMQKRNKIIKSKLRDIKILSASFDGWCKHQAGFTSGLDCKIMRSKKILVVLIDEHEAVDWI